jgi:hypothetical protein
MVDVGVVNKVAGGRIQLQRPPAGVDAGKGLPDCQPTEPAVIWGIDFETGQLAPDGRGDCI